MAGTRRRTRVGSALLLLLVMVAVVAGAVAVTILATSGDDTTSVATRTRPAPPTPAPVDPSPSSAPTPTTTTTSQPAASGGEIATLRVAEARPDGYERARFGGGWADEDGDCQDTRAEVLVMQSRAPVTFTTPSGCTVATGEWVDPWSGSVSTSARALDVDHTVPLANAWRSGAWAWTPAQRLAFANDLAAGHLIAIPLGENRAKGDDGPEEWRPPSPAAWCAYAQLWAAIKARWDLSATAAEWAALQTLAATC